MQNHKLRLGVYIGRFSPIHLGHVAVIDEMINKYGYSRSLVMIGSANTQQSLRHFFTYAERKAFIKEVYPQIRVVGLADYKNDDDWYDAIIDLVKLAGAYSFEVEYFSGCKEDCTILSQYTTNITILNRWDGTTPIISATGVRDGLIHNRALDGQLHPSTIQPIRDCFALKWAEFEKR